jgi:hypothetical protein
MSGITPDSTRKSTSNTMQYLGFNKTSDPPITFLLEFMTSPERPVIQVAAWLTFFDKFACINPP